MARRANTDKSSGDRFYLRIHVSSRSSQDLDRWERNITEATEGQIVPHHSFIDVDEEINPGYSSQIEGGVDDRFHLRFMPGLSTGPNHAGLLARYRAENGRESLEKARIIVNETSEGITFIVPQELLGIAAIVKNLKQRRALGQDEWWSFGNPPNRVVPITSTVKATDAQYKDWALYDVVLFGEGVGPVPMTLEEWAKISLLPYGIKEGDLDYEDAVEKAKDILAGIKVIEDEDRIVTPPKRPSLEKKRQPVRFRSDFFTSLIPGNMEIGPDGQKRPRKDLTDEERRPWEYWVRDQEKYPQDQGQPYWDVLGLTRDPEISLDPIKYRAVRTAWTNQTPYGREKHRMWNEGPDNAAAQRLYDQSEKGRKKKDAYKATEGGKLASKLYQKRKRVKDKIYRALSVEAYPGTDRRWTDMEADYYIWDNYGHQLMREQWSKGEDFFIHGPDTANEVTGWVRTISMDGKHGLDHIRPARLTPEDLDYRDGYTNPEIEDEE